MSELWNSAFGSNGKFLVYIEFKRLLSHGTLKLRWIQGSSKQGNTKEKVCLFCDQYRFRDDDIINYATINQL